jgi:putative transposase
MARRHTPEQVIAKVRQGQRMLNDGRPMVEVIKELQVTEATWKNAEASKRTKEL